MTQSEYNARLYAGQDMTGITVDDTPSLPSDATTPVNEVPGDVAILENDGYAENLDKKQSGLGNPDSSPLTQEEIAKAEALGYTRTDEGWVKTSEGNEPTTVKINGENVINITKGGSCCGAGEALWDFFASSTKWFQTNMYAPFETDTLFMLQEINFLPYYVKNHLANDFYTKMFAQMYPDPQTTTENTDSTLKKAWDSIGSSVGSAIGRVTNAVANQINSTINYATSLASSLTFGLVNLGGNTTSGKNSDLLLIRDSIPQLRVHEIRVNDKLTRASIFMEALSKLWSAGVKAGEAWKSGTLTSDSIMAKLKNALNSGLEACCQAMTGASASTLLSGMQGDGTDMVKYRLGGLAYAFIRNSLSGTYSVTYELPAFGQQPMLQTQPNGFTSGNSSLNSKILQMVNSFTGGNLAFFDPIQWKAGQLTFGPLSTKFYLFNDTLEMYRQNLTFIYSFVTHGMAIRDGFMYRPPCCYDVTHVGNRRCYFCSGDFKVKKVGKIRAITGLIGEAGSKFNASTDMINQIKKSLTLQNYIPANQINDEIIKFVPDAFEIDCTFTPIGSEMFNTFIYYFIENNDNPYFATGNQQILTTAGTKINYIQDELIQQFTSAFVGAL